ncbi:MAG: hypothetical protein INQ03_21165 [Candidatus Heimdallarchaeota archaeon]|nr:hypothetical protein [Candidatus Heimdallarchaeota archaeon]
MGISKDINSLTTARMESDTKGKWRKKMTEDQYHKLMVKKPSYLAPTIFFTLLISFAVIFQNTILGLSILGTMSFLIILDLYRTSKRQQKVTQISRIYLKEVGMENKAKCVNCGTIQDRRSFCTSCGGDL